VTDRLSLTRINRREIARRAGDTTLTASPLASALGQSASLSSEIPALSRPANWSQDLVLFVGFLNHPTHRKRLGDRGSFPGKTQCQGQSSVYLRIFVGIKAAGDLS
jgi:hypothetical protein